MTNATLHRRARILEADVADRKINLLSRAANENYAVFEAAEDAFLGGTTEAKNLADPLLLFSRGKLAAVSNPYHVAVFFPVSNGTVTSHCAVILTE